MTELVNKSKKSINTVFTKGSVDSLKFVIDSVISESR